MKKIFTLLFFALLLCAVSPAQRYLEEVFDDVTVTTNITYGMNATVIAYQLFGEAIPELLKLDFYEPAGDTETDRPLILYFHTGNFLPHPQNGSPGGLRTDSSVVELCTRMARMGYVVASCDYRLGWNPLAPTQEERVYSLINAAYRGVQDCRTAVRYFRMAEEEMGDPYHIDTDRIAVWGQGTGGYIAFSSSTINDYLTDVGTNPKFLWDPDGDGIPQPMVIDFVNGDINGTGFGVNPLDSDTLCYANWPEYSSEFHAMVNMGGAMGDLGWLEDGQVPMISFHATTDPFAPYDEGTVIVPVLNLPVVDVAGSYAVQEQANTFGNNEVFAGLSGDNYTHAANANNDGFEGLYPLVRPVGSEADSAPWEWWAPDNPNNANGLATNPDMSAEKGRAFCDTIQWYTAPRLACALNLPNNPCSGGPLNDPCDLAFNINESLGGAINAQNGQGPFANSNATTGGNDPSSGWECWLEPNGDGDAPSLDASLWFTFEGDGNEYNIFSDNCGGSLSQADYIEEGDTQFALYTGDDCNNLVPVLCNDDSPDFTDTDFFSEISVLTAAGQTYYLLVDGFNYTEIDETVGIADGQFCLQITNVTVGVNEIPAADFLMFPNPANDRVTINAKENLSALEVFDATGRLVTQFRGLGSDIITLNTAAWEAGMYTIKIHTASGASASRLVVE